MERGLWTQCCHLTSLSVSCRTSLMGWNLESGKAVKTTRSFFFIILVTKPDTQQENQLFIFLTSLNVNKYIYVLLQKYCFHYRILLQTPQEGCSYYFCKFEDFCILHLTNPSVSENRLWAWILGQFFYVRRFQVFCSTFQASCWLSML